MVCGRSGESARVWQVIGFPGFVEQWAHPPQRPGRIPRHLQGFWAAWESCEGHLFPGWASPCASQDAVRDGGSGRSSPAAIVSLCLGLLTKSSRPTTTRKSRDLGFVETALVALKDTKYFQTLGLQLGSPLHRNILTSEVWANG